MTYNDVKSSFNYSIKMQYFHINHISESTPQRHFKAGDVFEPSSKNYNSYYKSILNRQKSISFGGKNMPILEFFKNIQSDRYKDIPNADIANIAHSLLDDFIQFHRETHFENIRRAEFPDRPSRLNCIWLASSFEEALSWVQRLPGRKQPQIVKLEVENEPFRTNEGHLIQDSEPTQITLERARKYWKGEEERGRTELLYVGKLTILEVFKITES